MKGFASWLALALALPACTATVPAVDPTSFACVDDTASLSGELPCPASHYCAEMSCTPRLDCRIENATKPGCDPEQRCGQPGFQCKRCEALFNAETAAVRCENGIHTATSTPPLQRDVCGGCPDGTFCVVYATSTASVTFAGDAYPLFAVAPGTLFPASMMELPERRMCVRGCSAEQDCPAGHSCRAAAVIQGGKLEGAADGRSTIGACYPDLLTTTTTQADRLACRRHSDCPAPGSQEPCRFGVTTIPDHPSAPAGDAWGVHRAIIAQCSNDVSGNLQRFDMGCTKSTDCKSGLCRDGSCTIPCDPDRLTNAQGDPVCPSHRLCGAFLVTRDLPGGGVVEDWANVCADR